MWARHRRTGRRYRRSSTGCARRAISLGPCRTCCRAEPSLEAGAAVHLKARLFSAARGLLNARRGGRLRALAQDVDVDETARFRNFGGHAEGGRVEHGLLVTAAGYAR